MEYQKELKFTGKSRAELSITIKKKEVKDRYEKLLTKYSKELHLPGFRKGKAPVNVLESKYGKAVKSDLASDLIEEVLKEVFEAFNEYERPLAYSYPEMKDTPKLEVEKDFSFAVEYDVFPKVEIKKSGGFTVKLPEVKVEEADIQSELEKIRERNALVSDKKAGSAVEKNDIVTVNYVQLDDKDNVIKGSEHNGFIFTVGSKDGIYKFDDDILGMKKDESKDITKTFSADDENKELAGQTKKIRVTVTSIKYKDLPKIDDDLAQDVNEKYKTLADLKADIEKNIKGGIDNKLKKMKEEAVIDQMIEENPFELPESMINAELESRWIMLANQFRTEPSKLEKMLASAGDSKNDFLQKWKPDAEKSLKGRVLVEILLKDSNIEVSETEIEEEFKNLAEKTGLKLEDIKKRYAQPEEKEYLIEELKEDKLFEQIYGKSTISKGDKLTAEAFLQK